MDIKNYKLEGDIAILYLFNGFLVLFLPNFISRSKKLNVHSLHICINKNLIKIKNIKKAI